MINAEVLRSKVKRVHETTVSRYESKATTYPAYIKERQDGRRKLASQLYTFVPIYYLRIYTEKIRPYVNQQSPDFQILKLE